MRTAFTVLCSCLLLALGVVASQAQPRDRYDDGDTRPGTNVSYSSDCCYKKIVRTIREVRYVRITPPRRYGWGPERHYSRPHHPAHVHRPASYSEVHVAPVRRFGGYYERRRYDRPRYDRYDGYDDGYDAYNAVDAPTVEVVPVCTSTRVRVLDGKGGWVWGLKRVCS